MPSEGDHISQAYKDYVATKPDHHEHFGGAREGGWAAAIVALGGFVACFVVGRADVLSSFWFWFVLVAVAAGVGLGVRAWIARMQSTRSAKDEAAKRAEKELETERKVREAKILGKFDQFGAKE